jgi:purine nucleosidase
MTRKVIIDSDMGTDDAVALCMALFDESLDIVALTATEGCVTAEQATRNLQAVVGMLDPDRHPRLGAAARAEHAPAVNTTYLYGEDGLGNTGFEVSELQHMMPADKLIVDCVRAHPGDLTLVCLGPYTNLARAFRRDPAVAEMVDRVVMTGGSIQGIGNITQAAEFNCYFDPPSAQEVFCSRTTKTLIPLDVTSRVRFGLDLLDKLPERFCRVGEFLRQILPFAYRSYRQQLGQEDISLNDAVGMLAVLEPDLFEYESMAGQVETEGQLTRGVTVFDRRTVPEWRNNMEVAVSVRADDVVPAVLERLSLAGNAT